MRLTSLADYAVVMMAAAARHPGDTRLSATLLAGETGVPLPTAQKLMGRLASAGLMTRRAAPAAASGSPGKPMGSAWPTSSRRSKGRSR